MRYIPLVFLICLSAHAQFTVTTVAGGGPANSGLGGGIARDAGGNTYLCGGAIVSRLDPSGQISAFAGTGIIGYSGDGGPAIAAQFSTDSLCAVDQQGNLIVADTFNGRIRKIDHSGTVTTIAGTGIIGNLGDGDSGSAAQVGFIAGLAIDGTGNIYFTGSSGIRRLTPAGIVEQFAGSGQSGISGDGGPALAAGFGNLSLLAADGTGDLFVADSNTVRRIDSTGMISTIAGGSYATVVQDGQPATSGKLPAIRALAADAVGNVFLSDGSLIRQVDARTGVITTIAGNAGAAPFETPVNGPALGVSLPGVESLFVDSSGAIWFSTTNALQKLSNGIVATLATNFATDVPDGTPATAAQLNRPVSIAVSHSGQLYIGQVDCLIRTVRADGTLGTVPGTQTCGTPATLLPESFVVDSHGTVYLSGTNGQGVYAISSSGDVTQVPGLKGYYLAIDSHDRLYETQLGSWNILTLAPGGTVQTLTVNVPADGRVAMALDSADNLYFAVTSNLGIAQTAVYRVSSSGAVTPIPGAYPQDAANALAIDSHSDVWLVDYGFGLSGVGSGFNYSNYNHSPMDGPLLAAGFGNLTRLESGPDGSIYALDVACSCVRKIGGAPPAAVPAISAAVNAASFAGGALAPGELISVFGSNLGPSSVQSFTLSNNSTPAVLGDVEVLINGLQAPITAVSSGQINALAPYALSGAKSVTIQVNAHGAPSSTYTAAVISSAFGLFTADGSGSGQGAILNQDGSYNSPSNPAPAGTIVTLYGTGDGGMSPAIPSGGLVTTTPFPLIAAPVTLTIGGKPAVIAYAGAAPFLVGGVDQIDVAIPENTPSGPAPIAVTVGGVSTTKTVTVAVK